MSVWEYIISGRHRDRGTGRLSLVPKVGEYYEGEREEKWSLVDAKKLKPITDSIPNQEMKETAVENSHIHVCISRL